MKLPSLAQIKSKIDQAIAEIPSSRASILTVNKELCSIQEYKTEWQEAEDSFALYSQHNQLLAESLLSHISKYIEMKLDQKSSNIVYFRDQIERNISWQLDYGIVIVNLTNNIPIEQPSPITFSWLPDSELQEPMEDMEQLEEELSILENKLNDFKGVIELEDPATVIERYLANPTGSYITLYQSRYFFEFDWQAEDWGKYWEDAATIESLAIQVISDRIAGPPKKIKTDDPYNHYDFPIDALVWKSEIGFFYLIKFHPDKELPISVTLHHKKKLPE